MSRIKNREFWESGKYNNKTFLFYFYQLLEIALSRYKWIGLPKEIDERYLELTLFSKGMAVFFKDDELDEYLTLMATYGGDGLNYYMNPKKVRAYANNGYNRLLTNDKDCVMIYNNKTRMPTIQIIEMYAKRLWDLDRTIDVNVKAQKTPILITCEENQLLTMKNVYMKYIGDQPVIYGNKNLDTSSIKVLKTDAPYTADRIYELKKKYWNECLTMLGVGNMEPKKERMITDEAKEMTADVKANNEAYLSARQYACKKINDMFGLNVRCVDADINNTEDNDGVKETSVKKVGDDE